MMDKMGSCDGFLPKTIHEYPNTSFPYSFPVKICPYSCRNLLSSLLPYHLLIYTFVLVKCFLVWVSFCQCSADPSHTGCHVRVIQDFRQCHTHRIGLTCLG